MMASWGVHWWLTVSGGLEWTPEVLWFVSQEQWCYGFHGFLLVERIRGVVQDGSGCPPPVLRHQVQPWPQSTVPLNNSSSFVKRRPLQPASTHTRIHIHTQMNTHLHTCAPNNAQFSSVQFHLIYLDKQTCL